MLDRRQEFKKLMDDYIQQKESFQRTFCVNCEITQDTANCEFSVFNPPWVHLNHEDRPFLNPFVVRCKLIDMKGGIPL